MHRSKFICVCDEHAGFLHLFWAREAVRKSWGAGALELFTYEILITYIARKRHF
jgi:hypothetical protein